MATIIPRRYYRGTDNPALRASIYGVAPPWPHEVVEDGYTVQWPDGTVGHPNLPLGSTKSEAEAFAAARPTFRGCHQY
jgi:hypothetical protein